MTTARNDRGEEVTESTYIDRKCSCGSPGTTALTPGESVVHRSDGPCYITTAHTTEEEATRDESAEARGGETP